MSKFNGTVHFDTFSDSPPPTTGDYLCFLVGVRSSQVRVLYWNGNRFVDLAGKGFNNNVLFWGTLPMMTLRYNADLVH